MAMAFKAEDLDLDQFLNLDGRFSSPALANLNKGKNIVTPQYQQPSIEKINTYAPLLNSQTFAGPSHQYGLHKQHIPLPPGALANSLAAAQKIPFQYNGAYQQFGMGANSGFYDNTEEFVDFTSFNGQRTSYGGSNDIDMDFESPVDRLFSNDNDYVDPNAIGGHEEDSPVPARAEIVRVYPGMHAHQAQQAALAKQQQQQQQQQQMEIQKQQQLKAVQQPSQPTHKASTSRSSLKSPADPIVEERISRLLSQMRQTSSANADDQSEAQSPPQSMSRSRKDEDDMDEDERLLASEEGKKLSSKERRQLRNKVSARAFRSRRKEYIGQLEGEIAQKVTESDTLRVENEALKAENTRLTDLTKLLLSSPAFSTFLTELSANGLPPSVMASAQPAPVVASQPQSAPQSSRSSQFQESPSMNTIIEEDIDFNALGADSTWNSGMDFGYGTQVFAVTELPETVIDIAALSGKAAASDIIPPSTEKQIVPVIEVAPVFKAAKVERPVVESTQLDESDPAYALFADSPSLPQRPVYELFGTISFEKATETYDLVVVDESAAEESREVSAATMLRFETLCASLDSLSLSLDVMLS